MLLKHLKKMYCFRCFNKLNFSPPYIKVREFIPVVWNMFVILRPCRIKCSLNCLSVTLFF